jgi:homogentisate 1,2-dioxygenase
MRRALEQAVGPTAAQALQEILGTPVSANERRWLVEIRDAAGTVDPRPTALREMRSEEIAKRVVDGFKLPSDAPMTENERVWIEFLRIICNDLPRRTSAEHPTKRQGQPGQLITIGQYKAG